MADLKAQRIWFHWHWEKDKDGRITKVPHSAKFGCFFIFKFQNHNMRCFECCFEASFFESFFAKTILFCALRRAK